MFTIKTIFLLSRTFQSKITKVNFLNYLRTLALFESHVGSVRKERSPSLCDLLNIVAAVCPRDILVWLTLDMAFTLKTQWM